MLILRFGIATLLLMHLPGGLLHFMEDESRILFLLQVKTYVVFYNVQVITAPCTLLFDAFFVTDGTAYAVYNDE